MALASLPRGLQGIAPEEMVRDTLKTAHPYGIVSCSSRSLPMAAQGLVRAHTVGTEDVLRHKYLNINSRYVVLYYFSTCLVLFVACMNF